MGSLPAFLLLFAALYGAFGTESPFLPSFLGERGLSSAEIGIVLAAGTSVRLVMAPLAGHMADRHDATRQVLGWSAILAGVLSAAYLAGHGFWALLAVSMAHSVAVAALAPLADALALSAVEREGRFTYGAIRGAGSAAFIAGTLVSGQLVARAGLDSIVVASGVLFATMAFATLLVPASPPERAPVPPPPCGALHFLTVPVFRRLVLVSALVIGSHAMNDGFAVIRWRAAGIDAGTISLLWSASVAAEVLMFVVLGPWLLKRLGPGKAAALAAAAGIARWAVMATTTSVPVLALSQLGHGFTFALLHLANLGLISAIVPGRLVASALTLYATIGLGLSSVLLTLLSGFLFARFGADAFWAMAVLCLIAVPVAWSLRSPSSGRAA